MIRYAGVMNMQPRSSAADATAGQESRSPSARLRDSALGDDLGFFLARASALSLAAANSALAKHGLRVRSYSVLALAANDAGQSQRDLAEILPLHPSQVVALVDELQEGGLVRREPAPNDRRANVVVTTGEGRAVLERAQVSVREATNELQAVLSPSQRENLAEVLRLLAFPS